MLEAARVPHLWYDLYSRLFPGTAFVAGLKYFVLEQDIDPSMTETALFLGAGYFVGLIVQPIGSRIAYWMEKRADPQRIVNDIQSTSGRESVPSSILSKMHGETTFFCQCSVLATVLLVAYVLAWWHPWWASNMISRPDSWVILAGLLLIPYAIWGAKSTAERRLEKAKQFQPNSAGEQIPVSGQDKPEA